MRLVTLPKLDLARLPTPVEEAPNLARELGLKQLLIKREDLSGYALGGNKLRKLDYLMAAAKAAGADTVITTAGSQSNFCRALAAAAAKLNMGCSLLLRGRPNVAPAGNLLLMKIFGAAITFTDLTDPWDPRMREALDRIADDLRAQGRKPYVIQLPGESAALGAAAWVAGAEELARQWGDPPEEIYVAAGSALTATGLALGLKALSQPTRLVAISVQQPAARIGPWMVEVGARCAGLLGLDVTLTDKDFDIDDRFIGPGYGQPTAGSVAALKAAGRDGLVLDPIYTGKAMHGLMARARPGRRLAFLHSGGTPGLFAADLTGEL